MVRASRSFTLRLSDDLYRRAKLVAKRRGTSLNELTRSSLIALTDRELQNQLGAEYDKLGLSNDADVDFAINAQREVLDEE